MPFLLPPLYFSLYCIILTLTNGNRLFRILWQLFPSTWSVWTEYYRIMVPFFFLTIGSSIVCHQVFWYLFLCYKWRCSTIQGFRKPAATCSGWCQCQPKISKSWCFGFSYWESPTTSWWQCCFCSFCMLLLFCGYVLYHLSLTLWEWHLVRLKCSGYVMQIFPLVLWWLL